jgi:chromosome segregation ATPase
MQVDAQTLMRAMPRINKQIGELTSENAIQATVIEDLAKQVKRLNEEKAELEQGREAKAAAAEKAIEALHAEVDRLKAQVSTLEVEKVELEVALAKRPPARLIRDALPTQATRIVETPEELEQRANRAPDFTEGSESGGPLEDH